MNEEMLSKADPQDAEQICRQIADKAGTESKDIITKAEDNVAAMIKQAREEAEKEQAQITDAADKDIAEMEKKNSAYLNMEKKRILLRERGAFAGKTIDQVMKMAAAFRSDPGYPETLKKFIMEGLKVVAAEKIIIFYSRRDKNIFNDAFKQEIMSLLGKAAADFREDEFDDIGIVVRSSDERVGYDNRFAARLKREYEKIYTKLIKEAA